MSMSDRPIVARDPPRASLLEARVRARALAEIRGGGSKGIGRSYLLRFARKAVLDPILDLLVAQGVIVPAVVAGWQGRYPPAVVYIAVEFLSRGPGP